MNGVSALIEITRLLRFSGDSESAVVDIDLDILLWYPGKSERGRDKVFLVVLVEVHSKLNGEWFAIVRSNAE